MSAMKTGDNKIKGLEIVLSFIFIGKIMLQFISLF